MTFEAIVTKVREMFKDADVSGIKEKLAYQINIKGEGEGIFYAEVKDGKLSIEPYEYHDRDCTFSCTADVFFKLMSGELDPVKAFLTGKLKVEGDLGKAMKLKDLLQ